MPGDLLGLEKADPTGAPDEPAARGEARRFSDTEQAATWKRTVPPRYRGAVRRYFSDIPPASGGAPTEKQDH